MSLVSAAPKPSLIPVPWFMLALATVCMALGGLLAGQAFDRQLLLDIQVQLRDWPVPWAFLTWSGLGICGFVLLTSLSAEEPRRVAALVVALLVGGIVVHAMKRTLHVDRPATYFGPDHPVFHVIGKVLKKGSMPSGHSATAWAVAVLLVAHERGQASLLRHLWWVLAALQALSRAVVGAHWPSDILVGSGMGLFLAPLAWRLQASARLGAWLAQPGVSKAVALALPGFGLYLCFSRQGWVVPGGVQAAVMVLCLWGSWRWWQQATRLARSGSHA
jgi:membrane-associated phospholipid phosphatase